MTKKRTPIETLGDKLQPPARFVARGVVIALVAGLVGLLFGGLMQDTMVGLGVGAGAAVLLAVLAYISRSPPHFLLRHDAEGFMPNLKLARKTAIIDGSNLYHFGVGRKIGRLPLGAVVAALRSEGYRIVVFFDANIYFTLRDHGEFPRETKRFSVIILRRIFELDAKEIYVVPSGVQADKFILETLSHLPEAFVVTNDRFRDHEADYNFLTTGTQWRKGVKVLDGELRLYQHEFAVPLLMK